MNYERLAQYALYDHPDISEAKQLVKDTIAAHPAGYDLRISPAIVPALESWADKARFPLCVIAYDAVSVAETYGELYAHELMR